MAIDLFMRSSNFIMRTTFIHRYRIVAAVRCGAGYTGPMQRRRAPETGPMQQISPPSPPLGIYARYLPIPLHHHPVPDQLEFALGARTIHRRFTASLPPPASRSTAAPSPPLPPRVPLPPDTMVRPMTDEEVEHLLGPEGQAPDVNMFNNVFVLMKSLATNETHVISGPPAMRLDDFLAFAVGRLRSKGIAVNTITVRAGVQPPAGTPLSYLRDNIADEVTTMVHMNYV